MNPLNNFKNFLNELLENNNDAKLDRVIKTIHWQFNNFTHSDLRRYIFYQKCANDEIVVFKSDNYYKGKK